MIVVSLILGVFFIIMAMIINEDDILPIALAVLGSFLLFIFFQSIKPSAMDVYQGKTTLEITYKNDVPVDSVVVFKEALDIK